MSRDIERAIKALLLSIAEREAEVVEDKVRVNLLSRRVGRPLPFPSLAARPLSPPAASQPTQAVAPPGSPLTRTVHADQFANEPSTIAAVHTFLRWKGRIAGPQSFELIFNSLTYGGFRFGGGSVEKRRENLRRALAGDRMLQRVGSDSYTLLETRPVERLPRRGQSPPRRRK